MRKKMIYSLLFAAALTMTGAAAATFAAAEETTEDYETVYDDTEGEDPEAGFNVYTDEELAQVLDQYSIPDAQSYVTLGAVSGFEIEESIYPVEDYDVEGEIDSTLYDYSELVSVDRPAEDYDILTADITFTVDGKSETYTDYDVSLGYEELGTAFDQNLLGAKVGDTLTFSEDFSEDSLFEDWAGKHVDFEVTLTDITENQVPPLTDEWVSANTEFSTVEEFREDVAAGIKEEYERQAHAESLDEVLNMAVNECEFTELPQELIDSLFVSTKASYESLADMFGISLEELMEAYDISEDDMHDEADEMARTRIFLDTYAKERGMTVTLGDVWNIALEFYSDTGYPSPGDLLEDYGTEELYWEALRQMVAEQLLSESEVTRTLIAYSEEDLLFDDSTFEEDLYDDFEGSFDE